MSTSISKVTKKSVKKEIRLIHEKMPEIRAALNTLYRTFRLYSSNRSLRAWGSLLSHLKQKSLNRTVPPFITIAPTYRCVCRCAHCGVNSPERGGEEVELTTEQIKSVMDQAVELGVLQVTFTGGEPLLRKDIFELIRHAHHLGLLTRINTSGLLLDRKVVKELRKAGLTQGAVSIDDADPEIHDRLRGVPGAYEKALQGMRNLKDSGILCQINTYADRRNVPIGLKKIIGLGRSLGVLAVYIILPTAIGHWEQDYEKTLTEEEKALVRGLQETRFVHLELPTPKTPCGILKKMILFISPRGDVTPCPFVPYVFGNIGDHKLASFWRHHTEALQMKCLGECPMNSEAHRIELRRHVKSVAERLREE